MLSTASDSAEATVPVFGSGPTAVAVPVRVMVTLALRSMVPSWQVTVVGPLQVPGVVDALVSWKFGNDRDLFGNSPAQRGGVSAIT